MTDTITPFEIIVTMDDGAAAVVALDWAAEQARLTGVQLRIVYSWQVKPVPAGTISGSFWEASAAHARARATHWVLTTLGGGAASVQWVLDIVEGPPGPALVSRPGGESLLVTGMHEQAGLPQLLSLRAV